MYKLIGISLVVLCLAESPMILAADLSQKQICEANEINFAEAEQFAEKVQDLLDDHQAAELSKHIAYPLRLNILDKEPKFIKTHDQFIQQFDTIFTKATLNTVTEGDSDVFCTSEGASFGVGTIWFRTQNGGEIISVNVTE